MMMILRGLIAALLLSSAAAANAHAFLDHAAPRGFAGAHLFDERRLAAVPAGGELASRASLTLADLARHPVGLSPTAGSTTVSLWPAGAQPREIVTVATCAKLGKHAPKSAALAQSRRVIPKPTCMPNCRPDRRADC